MVKILQVLGTRPQIVKYTPITGKDIICWTGQHYSPEMSDGVWKGFNFPSIKYDLHETDFNKMVVKLEKIIKKEKPDCAVVYGDCSSTLAGATAAKDSRIKLAHVEAGIRSDYPRVETYFRMQVDAMADYNFCVNERCKENIDAETLEGKAYIVGDTQYDEYLKNRDKGKKTILATFHRAEHVDNKKILQGIFDRLRKEDAAIIFPVHPRTAKMIAKFEIKIPKNVKLCEPFTYSEIQTMYQEVKKVITDSGGVTKEAFMAGCPVEPFEIDEWPEIGIWGDGHAKEKIKKILLEELK